MGKGFVEIESINVLKVLGGGQGGTFFQEGSSLARPLASPYRLDCSVRLMMSSWRERERVVKRAE